MDGIIGDLIRNIENNWKEIGDVGKEGNKKKKKYWRQSRRKKNKNRK